MSRRTHRIFASGLAGVAASILAAGPAHGSYPGSNGSLASEYRQIDRGGRDDREIQVFGVNGRVSARLSPCERPEADPPSGSCPRNPSFSPDGTRIAFDREGRLALASADGTGLLPLPKLTAADADPAFSPDATELVFTGMARGRHQLYTVGLDGGRLKQLTSRGGRSPVWSSTGWIAYCAGGQVWRLKPGTRGRTRVARGCHPDWSPSGKSIAYGYKRNSYRVAARKGAPRKLVRRRAERPAFSPDGKRIVFQRPVLINNGRDSIGASIYTVDSRSGKRLDLVRRGGEQPVGSTYDYLTGVVWQPRR